MDAKVSEGQNIQRHAPMPIRYGAHCYLFTERWSDPDVGLLDTAKSLGLDAWEIAVGDDVAFSPAQTRDRAAALGITLTVGPGGEWPVICDLSSDDPAHRAEGMRWHKRQVDLAAEIGAVAYVGALYGHPGVVLRRAPQRDEVSRVAEGLYALATYGAQKGVHIVLEPMSHFRTHLVNTPQQALALIAAAGHDNLRVAMDTYHLVTEVRDYGAAIRSLGDRLWGLHACESDRGVPGGGLVPWGSVFEALVSINFDGTMMMETYNSTIGSPPGSFAYRRGMFHNPCPDGAAFVRQGLAFLKAGIEGRSHSED
jgi:D-psicose/D-tagatose/L-ribulose 3-epimerase